MSQQINLYRPIFRRQEKKFSARAMLQAGAILLAGIVVLYVVLLWQVGKLRDEVAKLDRQHAEASARLDAVTQKFGSRHPAQALVDRVSQLEQEVAARRRVQESLRRDLFANTHGYSDYFLAFSRQHVPGVWLTGFTISGGGDALQLQGRATDPVQVPRYVQRLAAERVLAGKGFEVFLLKRDKGPYAEFMFKTAADKDGGVQ